jgi:hypothetical protein
MVFLHDVPAIVINLPIIISIIAFTRYIIGFKTWKNYPVVALTLAYFLFFMSTGSILLSLLFWSVFTFITLSTAILTQYIIRKIKVNYYARIAIMYLFATIATLLMLGILNLTPLQEYTKSIYAGIAIFIIGTTIDELASLQFKKDAQEFIRRLVTIIILSLVSGLLLSWQWWNSVLIAHQEILLLVLVTDIVVAFWSSLRLTEYIRFSSILRSKK